MTGRLHAHKVVCMMDSTNDHIHQVILDFETDPALLSFQELPDLSNCPNIVESFPWLADKILDSLKLMKQKIDDD